MNAHLGALSLCRIWTGGEKESGMGGLGKLLTVPFLAHPSPEAWVEKPSFGKPLEEHLMISGREIAFPIEACVTMLLECGMQEEVGTKQPCLSPSWSVRVRVCKSFSPAASPPWIPKSRHSVTRSLLSLLKILIGTIFS